MPPLVRLFRGLDDIASRRRASQEPGEMMCAEETLNTSDLTLDTTGWQGFSQQTILELSVAAAGLLYGHC